MLIYVKFESRGKKMAGFPEGHILPTIRIKKIVLDNFKGAGHGEVIFNCGRKFIKEGTEPDILGIYGQNGSGKTSVIQALRILKLAMMGLPIKGDYQDCIANGAKFAKLEYTFDLQYQKQCSDVREVVYSFKIDTISAPAAPDDEDGKKDKKLIKRIRIFDEDIHISGDFGGEKGRNSQPMINTFNSDYPIGPKSKLEAFVGKEKESCIIDLMVLKRLASERSQSFIFMTDTLQIFSGKSGGSELFHVLLELKYYAGNYLYVVDSRYYTEEIMPLFTRDGIMPIKLNGSTRLPPSDENLLRRTVNHMNCVLPEIIPGLKLCLHRAGATEDANGDPINLVRIMTKRPDSEEQLPLRCESLGIIRLVSVLSLIIDAINDKSITVAIDELDAGIYEYLLGNILSIMEEHGLGQLVFTSHNLRPLEVLDKKYIMFTTANKNNRYIRLKGVGHTNNLRSLYLREITEHEQDEILCESSPREDLICAFKSAGNGYETEYI